MEIDSASVALGVWIGATLCPWLLSLGADDKKERRQRLAEDTFSASVVGVLAAIVALLGINALQGHSPI